MKPIIGDEDFSFMLQAEPGVYLRIGPGWGRLMTVICIASRHDFNDGILLLGRRCMPAGRAGPTDDCAYVHLSLLTEPTLCLPNHTSSP